MRKLRLDQRLLVTGRARGLSAALALLPFLLHGLAREVDRALGLLLHTSLDVPRLVASIPAALDDGAPTRVGLWLVAGIVAWLVLAALERRGQGLGEGLAAAAAAFGPLLIRPTLTALAVLSVAIQPSYPFALTLPVALTQDLGSMQDAAALAAFLAARPWGSYSWLNRLRAPTPRQTAALAFGVFLWLVPSSMKVYDGHTGNEPKTMRMAVTLGLWGTLDVEPIDRPMEELQPRSFFTNLVRIVSTIAREGAAMLRAALPGGDGVGAEVIRARRVARQTVSGKDGGVYHVLAPGPSALLAPALRADRALNTAFGTPGRVSVSLLVWFALSAAILAITQRMIGELTAQPGLAAFVVGACAALPPLVFFFYQFYPETLGALGLVWIAKRVLLEGRLDAGRMAPLAWVLAFTPWLHQKFLAVWIALVALAVGKAVHDLVDLRRVTTLLWPQAVSAFLYGVYNFAITGSARPDALFLAWGPGGISPERLGLGLFGLLLDARYGLLPYVPVLLLAPAGLVILWRRRSALLWVLVPGAVYYVTVASANNWAGSICNLGRFLLVLVPIIVVFVGVAWKHVANDPGRIAVCLTLTFWSGLLSRGLWHDPAGANDCALFLLGSVFADGNVYIPNLWLPSWGSAAPGLFVRMAAWIVLGASLTWWILRARREGPGRSLRAGAGLLFVVVGVASLLESFGSFRSAPIPGSSLRVDKGITAFVDGDAKVHRETNALVGSGYVSWIVRALEPTPGTLPLLAFGQGFARVGSAYFELKPSGVAIDVPLDRVVRLQGRGGVEETLLRGAFRLDTPGEVSLEIRR